MARGKGKARAKPESPRKSTPRAPKASPKAKNKASTKASSTATGSRSIGDGDVSMSDIRSTNQSPGGEGGDASGSGSSGDANASISAIVADSTAATTGSTSNDGELSATLSASTAQDTSPSATQDAPDASSTPSQAGGTRTRKRRATASAFSQQEPTSSSARRATRRATDSSAAAEDKTGSKTATPTKTPKRNKKARTTRGPSDAHVLFGPSRPLPSEAGPSTAAQEVIDLADSDEIDENDEIRDEDHWPRVPERLRGILTPGTEDPFITTPPPENGRHALANLLNPEPGAGFNIGADPGPSNGEPSSLTRTSRRRERRRHSSNTNNAEDTEDKDDASVYWHRRLPSPIPAGPPGLPALWPRRHVADERPIAPLPRRAITPETAPPAPPAPPHPNSRNGFEFRPRATPRPYEHERYEGNRRVNQFWTHGPGYPHEYAHDRYNLHAGPPGLGAAGPGPSTVRNVARFAAGHGFTQTFAGPTGPSAFADPSRPPGPPPPAFPPNMHTGPAAIGHGHHHHAPLQRRFADDFGAPFGGIVAPPGGFGGFGGFGDGYAAAPGVQPQLNERQGQGFTGLASPMRMIERRGQITNIPPPPPPPYQPLPPMRAGPSWVSTPPSTSSVTESALPTGMEIVEVEIVEVEEDELASESESDTEMSEDEGDDDFDSHDHDDNDPQPGAGPSSGGATGGATGGSGGGNSGNSGNSGWGRHSYTSSEDGHSDYDIGGSAGGNNDTVNAEPAPMSSPTSPAAIPASAEPKSSAATKAASDTNTVSELSDYLLPWTKSESCSGPDLESETEEEPRTKSKPLHPGEKYLALMNAHPLPDNAPEPLKYRYQLWLDAQSQTCRPVTRSAPHFLSAATSASISVTTTTTTPADASEDESDDQKAEALNDAVVDAVMKRTPFTLGMEAQLLATLADLPKFTEMPSDTELAAAIMHNGIAARRRSQRIRARDAVQAEKAAEQLLTLQVPHGAQGLLDLGTQPANDLEGKKDGKVDTQDKDRFERLPRPRSLKLPFDAHAHAIDLHERLEAVDPAFVRARLRRTHNLAVWRKNVEVEGYENYPGAWRLATRSEGIQIRKRERREEQKEKEEKEKEVAKGGRRRKAPVTPVPRIKLTFKRAKLV